MGTELAPSYANLFMSRFEGQYVYTNPSYTIVWKKITCDVFLIWPYGMPALEQVIDHLVQYVPL